MPSARSVFFDAIGVLRTLAGAPLLTDVFPPTDPHNLSARALRNGLVVSLFSLLETYLEDRLEEKVPELTRSGLSYQMFHEDLKEFLVLKALTGLNTRMIFEERQGRQRYAEQQVPRIASFAAVPPVYTAMGFSPQGSNVAAKDIRALLKAFGAKDVWGTMARLCKEVGASRVSLENDFTNLARARNRAAHDSATNVPTGDLLSFIDIAVLIGLSVDLILTHAVDCFVREPTLKAALAASRTPQPNWRFLDEASGAWKERASIAGRVVKSYPDKGAGTVGIMVRKGSYVVVVRDQRQMPIELLE